MTRRRLVRQATGSFLAPCLNDRTSLDRRFLPRTEDLAGWRLSVAEKLRLFRQQAEAGHPPHNPAAHLTMLLLSHMGALSDRPYTAHS